jgi:hypothetical protein
MSPTSMRSSTSRFPITTRDTFSFNRNNWLGMAEPPEKTGHIISLNYEAKRFRLYQPRKKRGESGEMFKKQVRLS